MRPVNLIPPEDRRGERAPLRQGPIAYVIVGALAIVLLAVTGIVLTGNQVTEREDELAALETRQVAVAAQATQLAPYVEFATMQADRETTLASLADSRFDWERVLRELALVNPADVWLTDLSGTAAGGTADSSGGSTLAPGTGAPALVIAGCAPTHEGVARFIAALEDIDGVTRVGLSSTARSLDAADAEGDATTSGCASSGRPATFSATAVFDGAPVSPGAEGAGEAAPVATEGETVVTPPGAENMGPEAGEPAGRKKAGGRKNREAVEALEGAKP